MTFKVDVLSQALRVHPFLSSPTEKSVMSDGKHYVMKGASPATAKELVRRSFRNWFRPNYPYVYASFRTVG